MSDTHPATVVHPERAEVRFKYIMTQATFITWQLDSFSKLMYTIFGQNSSPLEFHLKYSLPITISVASECKWCAVFSPKIKLITGMILCYARCMPYQK